jgi:hypothetical protein
MTRWTIAEIEAFRRWHIERLAELNYPIWIVEELSLAREKFLSGVRR